MNSPHGKQILASILMLILPRNNRMEDEIWGMGYLWLGPRCEPDRYGQCKTNRLRTVHARRVRALGTLNWRAVVNVVKMGYWEFKPARSNLTTL